MCRDNKDNDHRNQKKCHIEQSGADANHCGNIVYFRKEHRNEQNRAEKERNLYFHANLMLA